MTAITYGSHAPAHGATAEKTSAKTVAPKRGFFGRLWDAVVEARLQQAMREIHLHRHLLPAEFEIAGNRIIYKNEDQLPFVRPRD